MEWPSIFLAVKRAIRYQLESDRFMQFDFPVQKLYEYLLFTSSAKARKTILLTLSSSLSNCDKMI